MDRAETPEWWRQLHNELAKGVFLRAATLPLGMQYWLCSFNLGCRLCLENYFFLDVAKRPEGPGPKPQHIKNITIEDLRHLHATFCLALVGLHKPNLSSQSWEEMMKLPEFIYQQPKSYCDRWIQFINNDYQNDPARL